MDALLAVLNVKLTGRHDCTLWNWSQNEVFTAYVVMFFWFVACSTAVRKSQQASRQVDMACGDMRHALQHSSNSNSSHS